MWIDKELKRLKMNRRQFAEAIDVAESQVSRWAAGHTTPNKTTLRRLSVVLGKPVHVVASLVHSIPPADQPTSPG